MFEVISHILIYVIFFLENLYLGKHTQFLVLFPPFCSSRGTVKKETLL